MNYTLLRTLPPNVHYAEYFSNFIFGNHRFVFTYNSLIINYECANNKQDYQLFKNFSYPELA